jgi:hypothetical protein
MLCKAVGTFVLAGAIFVSAQSAAGQGFTMDYMDVGPTIGLGSIGSASLAIGGRLEKAFMTLPDLGDGIIGIQAAVDYYSWSGAGYSWSYIPIGVTGNYHFVLENKKIDPFLGLGLGYTIISCNYDFGSGDLCGNSTIYFIGRAGGRYFFADRLAGYADVGAGAALLNIGIMFKLR